jgi:outer membrane receptor protein involved in Fe transport
VALNAGARLQLSNTYDPTPLFAGALVWNTFGQTFLKLNYAEGFRPPSFLSTNVNGDIRSDLTFEGNPNLDVERSRAVEAEINSVLVDRGAVVDRWFVRADYSFSVLDDLISQDRGSFANSGTRFIHSVEVLSRLTFAGDHELSAAYYFVVAEDDELGPIRNIPNHILNGHGRLQIVPHLLHFSADVTWLGPREDASRRIPEGEDGTIVNVFPTDIFIEHLDASTILRAGLRATDIAGHYSFGVFGYNVLDQNVRMGDFFFDDRVQMQAQVNPRWSLYGTAEAHF